MRAAQKEFKEDQQEQVLADGEFSGAVSTEQTNGDGSEDVEMKFS